jgi:serine protease AprX
MEAPQGIRWRTRARGLLAAVALGCGLGGALAGPAAAADRVIVRERPGAGDAPERAVRAHGGRVGRALPVIDGFAAELPAGAAARVAEAPGVLRVTRDARVELNAITNGWDNTKDRGSLYRTVQEMVGAAEFWNSGVRGQGVDVALLDSGVAPVEGLRTAGKLVHGPDLSFESQTPELRHLDTFGHGTHLAGIIAGRGSDVPEDVQKGDERFVGVAPAARIVSVKLADAHGATDVSQVIAGIDWSCTTAHATASTSAC